MLAIDFIRENRDKVAKGARDKGVEVDIDKLLTLDEKRRKLLTEIQAVEAARNKLTKEEGLKLGKELKEKLTKLKDELSKVEIDYKTAMYSIPNLPSSDVKVGKDESENEVIRKYGQPTKFDFTPKDHLALGESLNIIDVERAAKVSGPRFAYLKGAAVLLELALARFAFDTLIKDGFIPVIPPVLIKKEVMNGLGYMEQGGDEDMFHLRDDDLVLVGTAEHSLVPMHKGEILQKKNLPLRYVGYSSSFRREAGSYGKDTRGILRVHQFNKVEMVSYVPAEDSDSEHEYLLSLEEKFFQALEIPYQVVKMCTGDLGFPASRKYDIEAWMPGQNKYREVTSVSTVGDFQSRRLNIKYQDGSERKYAHILNGTACAMSRTPIAILENYQQKDGSILIPKVLQSYLGFSKIEV